MGKPLPGSRGAIVRRRGRTRRGDRQAGVEGELALQARLALDVSRLSARRRALRKMLRKDDGGKDWYLTGDLARRDADGYFTFVGRADDIIKTAGHMVGPFEVESALMEHPAVAEAGVIGKPDPTIGEIVKAFVVLKPGPPRVRNCGWN